MQAVATPNVSRIPTAPTAGTMRAILHREYGTPDVLTSEEIARPAPGDDEVLVQVRAAGANIGDHHVVTGKPYLIRLSPFGGLPRPKHSVPGAMLAGVVTAVGTRVTTFKIGDEVFGQAAHGAFAEYVAVPAGVLAPKPKNLSFEEAACVPWAATALQGLRDAGGLVAGQKVLINGASGGVGTWAVQIAKAFGAEVTAVCSTRNVEQMRALGAAEVIDYTKEDYATGGPRFDLFFDTVGNRPLSDCLRAVKPKGTYVACAGGGGDWVGPVLSLIGLLIRSLFSSRKLKSFIMTPKQPDLMTLKELVEAGKARPIIEQSYALSEVGVALTHVGAGHAQGQTVIRVAGS